MIEVPAVVGARRRRSRCRPPAGPGDARPDRARHGVRGAGRGAALHGGRDRVGAALLAHPLIGQYELAGRLADRLIAENAPLPAVGAASTERTSPGAALPAVLAIDGGNSKTDVALVAADGTLLASARRPGRARDAGAGETLRVLGSGARGGRRRAQPAAGPGDRIAAHLSACVANADLPEEEQQLTEALRAEGWSDTAHVANDTFAVLRAGLDGPAPHWGVGGHLRRGHQLRGRGPGRRGPPGFSRSATFTGDWGGGHGLSRRCSGGPTRAEDGRGPQTALREACAPTWARPACTTSRSGCTPGRSAGTGLSA